MRTTTVCESIKPLALAMTAGLACFPTDVLARGIVGPGGSLRVWTEAVNDDWNTAGNWTGMTVPQTNDAVHILDGVANVFLGDDSADLASLYISFNRTLSTNGHALRVSNGTGSTTVNGRDSNLFIADSGLPQWDFWSSSLYLENEGRLQLSGGAAVITDQLTASDDGRIAGFGLLRVTSPNAAALNLFDSAPLSVSNGHLTIEVIGGGTFAPPQMINVSQATRSLTIDAPLELPIRDVTLGENCSIWFEQDWTVDGTIAVQSSSIHPATISPGNGLFELNGLLSVNSGTLLVHAETTLSDQSAISIPGGLASNSALRFESIAHAEMGHTTTLGINARLSLDGPIPSPWHGDIVSNAGTLESNEPSGQWDLHGNVTFGSLFGFRSRLEGSAATRFFGQVNMPGLGVIVDSPVIVTSGCDMHLAVVTTELVLNNSMLIMPSADVYGDGRITINPMGVLFSAPTADINVDIVSAGTFHAGQAPLEAGYTYIDGDYTQSHFGTLTVDLGGVAPLDHDVYECSGDAIVGGLLVVNLINGFEPQIGDTFDILAANASLSGSFDELAGAGGFEVSYSGQYVTLHYVGDGGQCPGDVTNDNHVDLADLNLVLANFGQASADGDTNGDGVVDLADLNAVLSAYGAICLI